ncbi:hypothetical protein D3C84_876090 [compost metagenome]
MGGGDSQGIAGALHYCTGWRLVNAKREGHTQHTFTADQRDFQGAVGVQFRHQGDEAGKREIGVTIWLACVA